MSPTRRVLAVAQAAELGGAEYSLLRNARALPRHGIEVQITTPGEGALASAARESGIPVHHLAIGALRAGGGARAVLSLRRARLLASRLEPDLVWLNGTVAGRLAPALTRHTLVAQVHDFPPRAPRPWRSARFWEATPIVMCDSRAVADLVATLGAPEERLRVVYVPVGPPEPAPRPDWADGAPVVGFVGRIEPRKGPLELLRAFGQMPALVPGVRLVMVGEDELEVSPAYAREVRALAHELGARVLMLGRVPDASRLMSWFDVFCLPSREEAFGVVAVEALAAGTPVVATRSGGPAEFIEEGVNGALVEVDDGPALTRALGLTLSRAPEMADAARRSAEPYSAERVAERVAAALHEALEARG